MSHELHYTSVPRGLVPGTRGFCTVAATPSLSRPLVERLESLSGYHPVFPPDDPRAALNPIVHMHVKFSVGGKLLHVLSRAGPAGLDYSSRPNKYAHHVVLDPSETPQGGPAWLLRQPGFMETEWVGEPRGLPTGRVPPRGDRPPGIATAWQAKSGDAGWAGALAEAFLVDPGRPVYLVFQPGMELLPLFEEAIALLPPARRWDVEFSTYFTQLPPGISCPWRGVLDGSSDAAQAVRLPGALVIDLCRPMAPAGGGSLVHLARTAERIDPVEASTEVALRAQPRLDRASPESTFGRSLDPKSPSRERGIELIPEMAARMTPGRVPRGRPRVLWRPLAVALFVAAVSLSVAYFVFVGNRGERMPRPDEAAKTSPPAAPAASATAVALKPLAVRPSAPRSIKEPDVGTKQPEKTESKLADSRERSPADLPEDEVGAATGGRPPRPVTASRKTDPAIASAPPLKPKPKRRPAPPTEPLVQFWAVRRTLSDLLTDTGGPDRKSLDKDIRELEIVRADNRVHTLEARKQTGGTVMIVKPSERVASEPSRIAKLEYDKKTLMFEWENDMPREPGTDVEVLDSVLVLRCADGQSQYVLLRDPKVKSTRALPLGKEKIGTSKEKIGTRAQSVAWSARWAGDPVALGGTKQQFRIRRWRVVCKLQDRADPLVFASSPDPDAAAVERQSISILHDSATLDIGIDRKHPAVITVRFQAEEGFSTKFAEIEQRLTALENQYGTSFLNRFARLEARVQDVRRVILAGRERKEGATDLTDRMVLGEDLALLDKIEAAAKTDVQLRALEAGDGSPDLELSAVVSLKLETGALVDVARFGEFETPEE